LASIISCSKRLYPDAVLSCEGKIEYTFSDGSREVIYGKSMGVRIENGILSTSGNLSISNIEDAMICSKDTPMGKGKSVRDEFVFYEKGCLEDREMSDHERAGLYNYITKRLTIYTRGGPDGEFKCEDIK
jgi:hypothetical protein